MGRTDADIRVLDRANVELATESLEARQALSYLISSIESYFSDPEYYECRGDEDCDHCCVLQAVYEAKPKVGTL